MRNARLVLAAATTAAAVLAAGSALAATATAAVNVRSGPGTNYSIVDTLFAGEQVTVAGCEGAFCYIDHSGPDGWVSRSYLSGNDVPRAGVNFGFTIGSDGRPSFNIGVGGGGVSDPPVYEEPEDDFFTGEVCFYSRTQYRGSEFCLEAGDSIRSLSSYSPSWNDNIGSIDNPDGLRVTVCIDSGYVNCRTYTTSASNLGDFNDEVSSIRVRD